MTNCTVINVSIVCIICLELEAMHGYRDGGAVLQAIISDFLFFNHQVSLAKPLNTQVVSYLTSSREHRSRQRSFSSRLLCFSSRARENLFTASPFKVSLRSFLQVVRSPTTSLRSYTVGASAGFWLTSPWLSSSSL